MSFKPFIKKFEIRWSDLDANRHVANAAYLNFMSHTRMAYLIEHGFGHREMMKLGISPVIFFEHIYYYKELFADKPIFVSLELKGASEDGMLFEFVHGVYDDQGNHHAHCELMGAFIDLKTRSMTSLPEEIRENLFEHVTKTSDFRYLTKADTRLHGRRPINRGEWFTETGSDVI